MSIMKTTHDQAVDTAHDILEAKKLHKKPDFTPFGDYILVTDEERQQTAGSDLIIPDKAQARAQHGYAIAAGAECKNVQEGDRLYFGKYAGTRIQFDGVPYWVLKEPEIYGKVGEGVSLDEVFS